RLRVQPVVTRERLSPAKFDETGVTPMAEQAELPKAGQGEQHPPIPADAMIVLPVRQTVLFPGIVLALAIGRKSSSAAAQEAVRTERTLGVVLQKDPAVEEPT